MALELVQALRRAQVLEAVLAEVSERRRAGVEKVRRRLGQEYLASVPCAHDPRRPMDVEADVSLVRHDGLAGVEADPHGHGSTDERSLSVACGGDSVSGARERDEERVTLRVHLDSTVPRESLTQHAAMLREDVGVTLPELVQKACGALDVREEQRDGSAGKLQHADMIARCVRRHVKELKSRAPQTPHPGLSRRRSQVRVPSLPLIVCSANRALPATQSQGGRAGRGPEAGYVRREVGRVVRQDPGLSDDF